MIEEGKRALIVDDEKAIRRFLRAALTARGWSTVEAETGAEAISFAASSPFDVVILDLGLPDMDGKEVIHRLREWTSIPVIVVSVKEQELDKVAALDAGADDYVTKPFSVGELLARLRATLRRTAVTETEPVLDFGELHVDLALRRITVGAEEAALTPTEYDLLRILALNAGRVMTHSQLLTKVWGPAFKGETHLLQVNISNLRRKIEPDPVRPAYIVTEPGVGYRFCK
jgi:two-component system, OmpR family, KDP operon response regulator KdpE